MAVTIDGTNGIDSPDFNATGSTAPANGIYLPAANTLAWATNSSERLRLDASGNLGLGVTPSAWYSTAKAIDINNTGAIATFTNGGVGIYSNVYLNASAQNVYKTSNYAGLYQIQPDTGKHVWNIAASGTAGNAITFTQAMTLDSSGNLLLGTTSADNKLTMNGGITINNSSGTLQGKVYGTGSQFRIENTSSTPIVFIQNTGTEYARIDSSGNLLVGTTSSALGNNGCAFKEMAVGTSWMLISHSTSGAAYSYMSFAFSGSQIGYIAQNSAGNAVTYNTTSDQRLKENIVDAPSAINSVNAIKIRSFDWKADGSHTNYGYIAQELLEVAPEAVSVPADPDEMMGVDFGKLTPRIIKALQELTQRLEALEAK